MIALPAREPLRARLRADRRARVALAVLGIVALAALLAPVLTPYSPTAQLGVATLNSRPPSFAHPLGTDPYSRDVLARLLFGARVSLGIAVTAVAVSLTIGCAVGVVTGYAGGALDAVLMRLVDTALSIPRLLLVVVVVALWNGVGVVPLTVLLGFTGWFGVSRLVRTETLSLRDREFILAARALGAPPATIVLRHVLPHVVAPALVSATLGIGNVILLEAGLSYLGIGVRAPAPSWGGVIQDAADRVADLWWLTLFPGLAILVTVFAVNALGDALRDALDPRQLPRSPESLTKPA